MLATPDDLMGLGAASRSLGGIGRNGKPVHPATLTRWIRVGTKLPNGSRLKLQAVRTASKLLVRPSWLLAFLTASAVQDMNDTAVNATAHNPELGRTTATRTATVPMAGQRSPEQRQRDSEAASAKLVAMGA